VARNFLISVAQCVAAFVLVHRFSYDFLPHHNFTVAGAKTEQNELFLIRD